jgi:predicted ATPase
MSKVLITGMSGTGKSTALVALGSRGYRTVDTDTDQWSHWVTSPDGPDWIWRDEAITERVLTGTAASNTHMITVNHSIGCTTSRATVVLNADVAQLMGRDGQRTRPTPP